MDIHRFPHRTRWVELDTSLGSARITKEKTGAPLIEFQDPHVSGVFRSSSMSDFLARVSLDRYVRLLRDIVLLHELKARNAGIDFVHLESCCYDTSTRSWQYAADAFQTKHWNPDTEYILDFMRENGCDTGMNLYEESRTLGMLLRHLHPECDTVPVSATVVPLNDGSVGVYVDTVSDRRELCFAYDDKMCAFGPSTSEPIFAPLDAGALSEHREFSLLLYKEPDLWEWHTYDTPSLNELCSPVRDLVESALERSRDEDMEQCMGR